MLAYGRQGGGWRMVAAVRGKTSRHRLAPGTRATSRCRERRRQRRRMTSAGNFSHLDAQGNAHMVDVSEKPVTRRVAEASCRVLLGAQTVIRLANLPKGDAFAVSRLAGIQGAKRTSELIPLAHPLPLDQVEVDVLPAPDGVEIRSRVLVTARTGAEMEAL